MFCKIARNRAFFRIFVSIVVLALCSLFLIIAMVGRPLLSELSRAFPLVHYLQ